MEVDLKKVSEPSHLSIEAQKEEGNKIYVQLYLNGSYPTSVEEWLQVGIANYKKPTFLALSCFLANTGQATHSIINNSHR